MSASCRIKNNADINLIHLYRYKHRIFKGYTEMKVYPFFAVRPAECASGGVIGGRRRFQAAHVSIGAAGKGHTFQTARAPGM